ncbi:MAG: lysine--tRNA ligase [Planctomycetota bacterium]
MSEEDLRRQRETNRDALKASGLDPYGKRFPGLKAIAEAKALAESPEGARNARIAGRMTRRRDMGKAIFCDIVDRTGKIQVYLKADKMGAEAFAPFKFVDLGDVLGFEGDVGKSKTGEITLFAQSWTPLAKCLRPPPEKWHGMQDVEQRFRRRWVDLAHNEEAREVFLARSRILKEIRTFLDGRGFLEVETPTLQTIPGGATARPFQTHHNALGVDLFLRIATEIPLKELLVGGLERVYEIGRCFRNEGIDTRHNPEYTSLELYQAYGDLGDMMDVTEAVVAHLLNAVAGKTEISYKDRPLKLAPPWPRREYLDLVREHAKADPKDPAAISAALKSRGVDAAKMSPIEALEEAFAAFVEPELWDPVFVTGQPRELAVLCKERSDNPALSERFELFVAGMEIANAYTELNDPAEQRKRLAEQAGGLEQGIVAGKVDEDFLDALECGMPPAGGLGIGIDRLVMILTGCPSIREVILFPLLRPEGLGPAKG